MKKIFYILICVLSVFNCKAQVNTGYAIKIHRFQNKPISSSVGMGLVYLMKQDEEFLITKLDTTNICINRSEFKILEGLADFKSDFEFEIVHLSDAYHFELFKISCDQCNLDDEYGLFSEMTLDVSESIALSNCREISFTNTINKIEIQDFFLELIRIGNLK